MAFRPTALSRDFTQPYVPSKQVTAAWLAVYHNAAKDWDLYELAERLVDLDHRFQLWRFQHMKTVERIIGYKPGTGGTGGRQLSGQGAAAQVVSGAVGSPHFDVAAARTARRRRGASSAAPRWWRSRRSAGRDR